MDVCYKPQIPKEYRDERIPDDRKQDRRFLDRRYDERRFVKRHENRLDEELASDEQLEERYVRGDDVRLDDRRREDRQYVSDRKSDNCNYRSEGRNYRQELLDRFSEMELEDHHEYYDHQKYFE